MMHMGTVPKNSEESILILNELTENTKIGISTSSLLVHCSHFYTFSIINISCFSKLSLSSSNYFSVYPTDLRL